MTSAQVLEELLHAYLPVNRVDTLDAALTLAEARIAGMRSSPSRCVFSCRCACQEACALGLEP